MRSQLHALKELALWAARRRQRLRVGGRSMGPGLSEGDFVLVNYGAPVSVGDVVVAEHPFQPGRLIIKRLATELPGNQVELLSDNPEAGTDSRSWGPVNSRKILGLVTLQVEHAFSNVRKVDRSGEDTRALFRIGQKRQR